jgi:DNA-binding response OmpR family regulator
MSNQFEINILLLVEDSDDDIIITQRKLYKSEIKINEFIVAKTLTEGISIVKNKNVDVVLLDLNLPEAKGLDTLTEFRKVYSGIIIVVTSLEDQLTGIEAIRQGADEYLVKNGMTEQTLARAILHSRERRKIRSHVISLQENIEKLQQLTSRVN